MGIDTILGNTLPDMVITIDFKCDRKFIDLERRMIKTFIN